MFVNILLKKNGPQNCNSFCDQNFSEKKETCKMAKKTIVCGCREPGCNCQNEILVQDYVPDGTPIQCEECKLEHLMEEAESTSM